MRLPLFFLMSLLFFVPTVSNAADQNGYAAQYECRAGNPNCDVDVTSLALQPCQQIVSASTSWSNINWSNNVICLEAGDHTVKGVLTLQSSGSGATRKVLRYYRSSDNNDDPWNQSSQAKLYALDINGADYWIVHRITIDPNKTGNTIGIYLSPGSAYNIFNRVLVQRTVSEAVSFDGGADLSATTNNSFQNSVIRNTKTSTGAYEAQCFSSGNTSNTRFVNNEAYDCNKVSHVHGPSLVPGFVVENNDMYVSSEGRTDCHGNYTPTGTCSIMEALMSWKGGATSASPAKIIHNRMWGTRWSDGNLIQAGDSMAISLSAQDINGGPATTPGADYVLVQNNIIFDSEIGIHNYWDGPNNNSIIGNIFYDIRDRNPGFGEETGAIRLWRVKSSEVYLNTMIETYPWLDLSGGATNNDVRCNVQIASGSMVGNPNDGALANNAYFGTTRLNDSSNAESSLRTRASSTTYSVGEIIRFGPASACTVSSASACFLYRVAGAGTSAATETPGYCTQLGCTTVDGGIQVQAIRGPYTFNRKLRTGAEQFVIPYARVYSAASEAYKCPSDTGLRPNIGINDVPLGQ